MKRILLNTTANGCSYAITVAMPNRAGLTNITLGGGHFPCTGVLECGPDTRELQPDIAVGREGIQVRKLTPREAFRLMGCSDLDISKIQNYPLVWDGKDFVAPDGMQPGDIKKKMISESQQYKMAGNSIVVDVLMGIFTQMFREDKDCLF